MANYGSPNEFYTPGVTENAYNFEMPEFDQELNFQNFDNNQPTVPPNYDINYSGSNPSSGGNGMSTFYDPNTYVTNPYEQDKQYKSTGGTTDFDDEPPLLEELGINPNHIFQKTLAVLNPLRGTDQTILQDTDMAGPLVFCLALGGFLLLSGKVTFSYIYGVGAVGCLAFYSLLTLMASQTIVTFGAVVSVLGYCLLPMVVLSGINVLITIQQVFNQITIGIDKIYVYLNRGTLGLVVAGVCIFWCSLSASKLFVTAYSMDHQQMLIAYPCALFYGVFALITIF